MGTAIQRQRLGQQVAAALESELQRGTWTEQLPGERALSRRFGVSRPVLRQGLLLLQQSGRLSVESRRGYRIRRRPGPSPASPPVADVHVLLPAPVVELRLFTNLWLDALRQRLHEEGGALRLHVSPSQFLRRPSRSLTQLVRANPGRAWILVHSTNELQKWFAARPLRAMIAGSAHAGIRLPAVGIDVAAAARHAAGVFARLRHRDVAFLNLKSDRAGDRESESQFLEAAAAAGLRARVLRHDSRPESIAYALQQAFVRHPAPTALLIGHSRTCLTAMSVLARIGRRVPEEVSLIVREDDTYLDALIPSPARYHVDPRRYAAQLHRMLRAIDAGQGGNLGIRPLLPEFRAGPSLRRMT